MHNTHDSSTGKLCPQEKNASAEHFSGRSGKVSDSLGRLGRDRKLLLYGAERKAKRGECNAFAVPEVPEVVSGGVSKKKGRGRVGWKTHAEAPKGWGAKRKRMEDFSYRSRTGLRRKLNAIRPSLFPSMSFVTLTYPGEWPKGENADRIWKKHQFRWMAKFRNRYPGGWVLWCLEIQARGAPHFHLIVHWGEQAGRAVDPLKTEDGLAVDWKARRAWLSKSWERTVSQRGNPVNRKHLRAGTSCRRVYEKDQLMAYLRKAGSKAGGMEGVPVRCGRWWGISCVAAYEASTAVEEVDLPQPVVRELCRATHREWEVLRIRKGWEPFLFGPPSWAEGAMAKRILRQVSPSTGRTFSDLVFGADWKDVRPSVMGAGRISSPSGAGSGGSSGSGGSGGVGSSRKARRAVLGKRAKIGFGLCGLDPVRPGMISVLSSGAAV